ncbi:MAG TPA: SagB/ThcOx family dehydrogenase [Herpetosiphonaceae bacterium]
MQSPRPEVWLRAALARVDPVSANGLIDRLVTEKMLVPWSLGARLVDLHLRTTVASEWAAVSPAVETSRILREAQCAGAISLPAPAPAHIDLMAVLNARRSCRAFHDAPMRLSQFATLLACGVGLGSDPEPPAPLVPGGPVGRRTYPSGGGLYAVETLVYPLRVEDVSAGFYSYQALAHRIVPVAAPRPADDLVVLLGNHPIEHASVIVCLFVDFARPSLGKYGEKAYRLALLEAGHMAQNVVLVATGLGYAALPICGFDDAALSRAAALSFPHEAIVYVLALGAPAHGADA